MGRGSTSHPKRLIAGSLTLLLLLIGVVVFLRPRSKPLPLPSSNHKAPVSERAVDFQRASFAIEGRVIDGSGQALGQATVQIGETRIQTDDKGCFKLKCERRNKYVVQAFRNGGTSMPVVVEVSQEKPIHFVTLVVEQASEVWVQVLDDRGTPISQATVQMLPEMVGNNPGSSPRTKFTEVNGTCQFLIAVGDQNATYVVEARSPGLVAAAQKVRITRGKRSELTLVLKPEPNTRFLRGRITDESGRPISNCKVHCYFIKFSGEDRICLSSDIVMSDEMGNFAAPYTFEQSRIAQGYQLRIHVVAESFTVLDRAVEFGADTLREPLVLRRGATVAGKVIDNAGQGIKGCWIRILNPNFNSEVLGQTITNDQGEFTWIGVGEDSVAVLVDLPEAQASDFEESIQTREGVRAGDRVDFVFRRIKD